MRHYSLLLKKAYNLRIIVFALIYSLDRPSVSGETFDRQCARPVPSEATGAESHSEDQQSQ